ncbi:Putative F-box protein [[Torrubiella] hemipterigena]|uniref:Putative F-box protein n=1 Tax=[Torrubiella] hemipterigena TaxID=1531966 RepID=A0A0A1TIY5_9HYPO|nr:Putative F-box protein [[Torrubiella] hemipterigena]
MPSAVVQLTDNQDDSIPTHPLNVKPLGNRFLATGRDARANAGSWAILPDEVLMTIFEQFDDSVLLRIGSTCKLLYAFANADELWKALFLKLQPCQEKKLKWLGSWRSTVLGLTKDIESRVSCDNVYSDVLHRPFACSNIHLSTYADKIPKANQIRRLKNLAYEEYADSWTETPFILTECIQEWPVFSKWSIPTLLEQYADVAFRAEAVDWTFSRYCDYMNNTRDESPLYLFDRKFAEKMELKVGHEEGAAYWRPDCFGPDMFELLGAERPAHRWMIIGPQRSGSTFHKDPNGTSAWNAVIQGSKYWIMFPPNADVPGVYVSKDSSEVTSPLSIAEWLLTFHDEARNTPGCIEGICETGEILHVPSGWWHLVVNLENGIALTQNFVPKSPNLKLLSEAIGFLRDKPDQVSGFEDGIENPYKLFADRLKQSNPEMLERALEILDKAAGKKRKWDDVLAKDDTAEEGTGGFSFGFGGGDLDEDEIP